MERFFSGVIIDLGTTTFRKDPIEDFKKCVRRAIFVAKVVRCLQLHYLVNGVRVKFVYDETQVMIDASSKTDVVLREWIWACHVDKGAHVYSFGKRPKKIFASADHFHKVVNDVRNAMLKVRDDINAKHHHSKLHPSQARD